MEVEFRSERVGSECCGMGVLGFIWTEVVGYYGG